jgi:hypothetical protein
MERCFRLPLDFESRPWFRGLASLGVGEVGFSHVQAVVELFRELGYAAETEGLGFLPEMQGNALARVGLLERCGLLKKVEGGWQCDVFARLNPELDADHVPEARKGGFARAAKIHLRKAGEEAVGESGASDLQALFSGMEAPEVLGSLQLVKAIDNAYGRKARKPLEWSEGLREDAKRVRAQHEDAVIEAVIAHVLQRRRDARMAGVPANTEELLRSFEAYSGKV